MSDGDGSGAGLGFTLTTLMLCVGMFTIGQCTAYSTVRDECDTYKGVKFERSLAGGKSEQYSCDLKP